MLADDRVEDVESSESLGDDEEAITGSMEPVSCTLFVELLTAGAISEDDLIIGLPTPIDDGERGLAAVVL